MTHTDIQLPEWVQ